MCNICDNTYLYSRTLTICEKVKTIPSDISIHKIEQLEVKNSTIQLPPNLPKLTRLVIANMDITIPPTYTTVQEL